MPFNTNGGFSSAGKQSFVKNPQTFGQQNGTHSFRTGVTNTGFGVNTSAGVTPTATAPLTTPASTMAPAPVHTMAPAPVNTMAPAPVNTMAPAPVNTMAPAPVNTMAPAFGNTTNTQTFKQTSAPIGPTPTPTPEESYIQLLLTNLSEVKNKYEQLLTEFNKQSTDVGKYKERSRIVDDLSRFQHSEAAQIIIKFQNGAEKDIILPSI